MDPIERVIQTDQHIYLVKFTPEWEGENPNDVEILGVDGEFLSEEEQVPFIQELEKPEHEAILKEISQFKTG